MKKLLLILSVFSILVFNSSCQKINHKKIWKCNNKQNLDSAEIVSKLIGSWKWKYYSSPVWTNKQYKSDKDVIITFNSNLTFSKSENGEIENGNFTVSKFDGFYYLYVTPRTVYLSGRIAFSKNEVIFDESPGDGNIYLFEKEK
ncbi:MAG: hypothetical protein WCI97_10505 [Bacteroidota bacterium]